MLRTGESVQLVPENLPEGATDADCIWYIGNTETTTETASLRVDQTGVVTALAPGQGQVKAEIKNLNGKAYVGWCTVAVIDKLVIDVESAVLLPDYAIGLTVTTEDGGRPPIDVIWTCEDPAVVSFDEYYHGWSNEKHARAASVGETTVTASVGNGVEASCKITVLDDTDVETYRYLVGKGEYETARSRLEGFFDDGSNYTAWLEETAPAALKSAYPRPVDFITELFAGHEDAIEKEYWENLWKFGLLPADEWTETFSRLPAASEALRRIYGADTAAMFDANHGNCTFAGRCLATQEQLASLGTEPGGKAVVLLTAEESYREYYQKNKDNEELRAIFDDGMAGVLDCGLTALLPERLVPERPEEVSAIIELSVSGVIDDTKYYYSDTKKLADDVTVIKTRVTCRVKQLVDGVWTEVYDAGTADGTLPGNDFYSTKLVVGYLPDDEAVWPLIADAAAHLQG